MKLQVMVSDDVVTRIDKLAEYIGASRSSVCAAMLVKALPEWESCYIDDFDIVQETIEIE